MTDSVISDNLMCNRNQMSKNLPLKKRRVYMVDSSTVNDQQTDLCPIKMKQACLQDESLQSYMPVTNVVPTPPSSPHLELLRQQYAYLLGNSTNVLKQNYFHQSTYESLMPQQYLENYRALMERQQQQYGYIKSEDHQNRADFTIDEHFRKSLENYNQFAGRCFTPDDSSSHSSTIEQTSADSIEEHFARSLAKFRPQSNSSSNDDRTAKLKHQITESVVDDHFAKALGSTTWEKLKERL